MNCSGRTRFGLWLDSTLASAITAHESDTPLEAGVSHKYYAPGVGMIKDDEFELAERP